MKIKKGDSVIVRSGKDKGKTGTIVRAFPKSNTVLIDDVNVATRHQKSRAVRAQGQIIKKSVPVHVSNVMLLEGKKPVRVGYKVEEGKKVRVSRASGKAV